MREKNKFKSLPPAPLKAEEEAPQLKAEEVFELSNSLEAVGYGGDAIFAMDMSDDETADPENIIESTSLSEDEEPPELCLPTGNEVRTFLEEKIFKPNKMMRPDKEEILALMENALEIADTTLLKITASDFSIPPSDVEAFRKIILNKCLEEIPFDNFSSRSISREDKNNILSFSLESLYEKVFEEKYAKLTPGFELLKKSVPISPNAPRFFSCAATPALEDVPRPGFKMGFR